MLPNWYSQDDAIIVTFPIAHTYRVSERSENRIVGAERNGKAQLRECREGGSGGEERLTHAPAAALVGRILKDASTGW